MFNNTNGLIYNGLPDTCTAMYPCPFDVQQALGVTIPGSNATSGGADDDHIDPDGFLDLS